MYATGYQFFVAAKSGVRLPVREDRQVAERDRDALGPGAEVIPLLAKQAQALLMADSRQQTYAEFGAGEF